MDCICVYVQDLVIQAKLTKMLFIQRNENEIYYLSNEHKLCCKST